MSGIDDDESHCTLCQSRRHTGTPTTSASVSVGGAHCFLAPHSPGAGDSQSVQEVYIVSKYKYTNNTAARGAADSFRWVVTPGETFSPHLSTYENQGGVSWTCSARPQPY